MYTYCMIIFISAGATLCNALLKKYQSEVQETFVTLCLFNLVNAVTASVFFFTVSKCDINTNAPTLLFSLAAALIVALNIVSNVYALSAISLAVSSIITTAGTIVGTSMFGYAFLNEKPGLSLIFSILLLLIAVTLPFVRNEANHKKSAKTKKANCNGILICLLLFITSGMSVIINKLYAVNPDVGDTNSYFFMLNFVLVVACVFVLLIYKANHKISVRQLLHVFSVRQTMFVVSRTLASNISAVVTMSILANMHVSLYAVLTTSFTLIGSALVSRYYFKEDMPTANKISVALAIIAIINIH